MKKETIDPYIQLLAHIPSHVTLVVVSKYQTYDHILHVYQQGQRVFAENKVQQLLERKTHLPDDIQWHMIGHLQTNKVKHIAPFIHMIQSADSVKLLEEINKQAKKNHRVIPVLLQVKIAKEDTKFGFQPNELKQWLADDGHHQLEHLHINGVMGMGTLSDQPHIIEEECQFLQQYFYEIKEDYFPTDPYFKEISMGMSNDYPIAIQHGSTMVRIGSAAFPQRD
jgi:PLP dependent protein